MPVEIHCVRIGSAKIRVRIAAYVDDRGARHENVYNNEWNCQFPNSLREENKRYMVPDENVTLRTTKTGKHFYHVSTRCGLQQVNSDVEADGALNTSQAREMQVMPNHIFTVSPECVVCMDTLSTVVFSPCGHFCSCEPCAKQLRKCCICRSPIMVIISK